MIKKFFSIINAKENSCDLSERHQALVAQNLQTQNQADSSRELKGVIDDFLNGSIVGWALDSRAPGERVRVKVLVDGEPCGESVCSLSRPDLRNIGFGDGNCGFKLSVPENFLGRQSAEITLVAMGQAGEVELAKRSLQLFDYRGQAVSGFLGFKLDCVYGWVGTPPGVLDLSRFGMRINGQDCGPLYSSRRDLLAELGLPEKLEKIVFFVPVRRFLTGNTKYDCEIYLKESLEVLVQSELNFRSVLLFDREYYAESNPDLASEALATSAYYLEFGGIESKNILPGAAGPRNPHLLFDCKYYCSQFENIDPNLEPLEHYLTIGSKLGLSPHPLFDPRYYLEQLGEKLAEETDPLTHFLLHGAGLGINPHPMFDMQFYRKMYLSCLDLRNLSDGEINPLVHFLTKGFELGYDPHPLFDLKFYNKQRPNSEITNGLVHYILEGRFNLLLWPNALFSPLYIEQHSGHEVVAGSFVCDVVARLGEEETYFSGEHKKLSTQMSGSSVPGVKRVIAISHDASRTGAPLILLNLLRDLKSRFAVEILVFVLRGGELEDDFDSVGTVINCSGLFAQRGVSNFAPYAQMFCIPGDTIVIANSAESFPFCNLFSALELPMLSLIHEFSVSYPEGRFSDIYLHSHRVVLPSDVVLRNVIQNSGVSLDLLNDKSEVCAQGVFPRLVDYSIASSREDIRRELGVGLNTFVVVGCGYFDARKGCDLFVVTAQIYREIARRSASVDEDFIFVWIGSNYGPDVRVQQFQYWISQDIQNSGLAGHVRMIGAKQDISPYLRAADVFFLPSRLDPFPCVVLEAMEAGLPTILFAGVTGSVDVVKEAGFVVPFLDVASCAEKLWWIRNNPQASFEMGQKGKRLIEREFNFSDYTNRIVDLMGQISVEPQPLNIPLRKL